MKLENIVFVENRLHENSTQIYFENICFDGDEFFVPVGNYTQPIGFLKFKQIAKKGCFELSELVSLDYPNPNPQLSLTGVLYSRQEAIRAQKLFDSFGRVVDLTR
ncbi:hypothetical protein [Acinetobacter sp.]|uniref:hypothetical protein n=1 Tax=Acinetobacter sp. TaxID=472 RepID=UPI00334075A5